MMIIGYMIEAFGPRTYLATDLVCFGESFGGYIVMISRPGPVMQTLARLRSSPCPQHPTLVEGV